MLLYVQSKIAPENLFYKDKPLFLRQNVSYNHFLNMDRAHVTKTLYLMNSNGVKLVIEDGQLGIMFIRNWSLFDFLI